MPLPFDLTDVIEELRGLLLEAKPEKEHKA